MNALKDIRVLDLTHVLSGPYCTMMLGDYGADVIKVEKPEGGDLTRSWGPPFKEGQSAYFLSTNRNKRSITLNLKTGKGKELLRTLVKKCDVLVENFRPGTLAQMGLGYEALSKEQPRLVYCSLSGYGQTGPEHQQPGFDLVLQGRGGLMGLTGPQEGPPALTGVAVIDLFTALHAVGLILAALRERDKTGKGSHIDLALLDSAVSILIHRATAHLMTGQEAQRHGNAHPQIVPYQTFQTRDGWVNIAVGSDGLWKKFCEALSLDDLKADARYATNALRVQHRETLIPLLDNAISQWSSSSLLQKLEAFGIPAGPIQDLGAVCRDPQVLAREMIHTGPHDSLKQVQFPAAPGYVNGEKPAVRYPPPLLGQHTDEILETLLGVSLNDLVELKNLGIV